MNTDTRLSGANIPMNKACMPPTVLDACIYGCMLFQLIPFFTFDNNRNSVHRIKKNNRINNCYRRTSEKDPLKGEGSDIALAL